MAIAPADAVQRDADLHPPGKDRHEAGSRWTAPGRLARRLALHPAWIVILAASALLVRRAMGSGLNTDAFWQVAAGNWMLSHHAVIRHDVFSYTVRGRPWLAEEWGFEVALAWMVHHVGPVSYWLVSAGASVVALIVSVARWNRLGARPLWAAALAVLAAFGLLIGLAPRPQDPSYLFFALELLVLTLARRNRAWLLSLPPLVLVWANVHGSFLLGLTVLVLEVAATLVASARRGHTDDRPRLLRITAPLRLRDAGAALVACVLAAMVNPHGIALFGYALRVSASSRLNNMIIEWQSPDFHNVLELGVIALPVLVAVAVLAWGRVHTELVDLVLWLGLLVATLHAVRFAPYAALAFCGFAASWRTQGRSTMSPSLLTWPISAVLCAVLLVGHHVPAGSPQRTGFLGSPVAATSWLRGQHGRVFSTYAWNDYLIGQRIPVFVDGRTDLYFGTGILSTYTAVSSVNESPDPVLRRWDVRWVLWPARTPLAAYLAHDPHWRIDRRFGTALVFERVNAPLPGRAH